MIKIHKEGYKTLTWLAAILVLLNIGFYYLLNCCPTILISLGILSVGFFLAVTSFFRNPDRTTPVNANQAIAPADGKVVVIEETEEPEYFKDKRLQVSIFMSPANVHLNRNPISGVIKYAQYHKGLYLVAWHPKSSTENERNTIVIGNDKQDILVRQIAGKVARKIVCYVKAGDTVTQGQEFGFIKFGSRVDIFFPIGTKILTKIGDTVRGGETVIAEFK